MARMLVPHSTAAAAAAAAAYSSSAVHRLLNSGRCLQSTAALPWTTIIIILVIWAMVTIPLCVLGGIVCKNNRGEFSAPCRTNKYPREIPELPWCVTAGPCCCS